MENFSLADISAVMNKEKGGGFLEGDSLIILILFFLIFGGLGGKQTSATSAEVYDATTIQSNNLKFDSILASINQTNLANAQNTASITQALNTGFDGINMNINMMNQNLSHQLSDCCCSMKTQMLNDKIDTLNRELNNASNIISNQTQSQYILSQLGKFVPTQYAIGTTVV